jgi:CoA:oxalate CoA-transferase
VIIENFRPSTMKKMGFGWEEIRNISPRIIYAAISGFGHDSPPEYAARASYDMVAQGYSGLMSITGPVGGPPCRVGSSVGDIIAGQQAVIGIMAALAHRDKTGRGQFYDGSMVDGLFSVLESAIARYTISGKIPGPLGGAHPSITPFEAFRTKDSWVIVAVGNDVLWGKLCRLLGREELIRDPRFENNHLRTENQPELSAILTAELIHKTTGAWIEIFEKQDIPYSKINNIQEICEEHVGDGRPARCGSDTDRRFADPLVGDTGGGAKPRPAPRRTFRGGSAGGSGLHPGADRGPEDGRRHQRDHLT